MKRYAVLLSILLLIVVPTVLAQDDTTLLRNTLGGNVSTLNPILAADSASLDVISFLFEGLFDVDPQTAQPMPALTTWDVSDDGLTYTFHINADANWSDGTPITANDVLFTYNAIKNDAVESPRKGDIQLISDLTVDDDKTFTVTLSQPNCTVWGSAFNALAPIPEHMYSSDFSEFMTNDFNNQPTVTSGPYVWSETSPDEFVRLTANENYYKGAPKIPTVINRVIADAAIQNQALQTGEIDYAFMYPDQLEQLGDQDPFNVFVFPLNNTPMLIMNWADLRTRKPRSMLMATRLRKRRTSSSATCACAKQSLWAMTSPLSCRRLVPTAVICSPVRSRRHSAGLARTCSRIRMIPKRRLNCSMMPAGS